MCQVFFVQNFIEHMTNVIGLTKKHLIVVQQRKNNYAYNNIREISFEVDQLIFVSIVNIKL
jgi:hypothetical protein